MNTIPAVRYELRLSELLYVRDYSTQAYRRSLPAKPSILVVDDESLITDMYKMKFVQEGYDVYTAPDGARGLALAQRVRPTVILTDIVMPRYNGWYLLKKIKNDPVLRDTPVITLSNLHDDVKRERACRLGALYFLVKSECLPKDLAVIIKAVVAVKAASAVAAAHC